MESATVVSIVPMEIHERKPLLPGTFDIAKGSLEEPATLLVTRGINDIYVGEGRGQFGSARSVIRVPVDAGDLAESVVKDWVDVQYGVILPDTIPGLFWLPGVVSMKEILASPQIQRAHHQQLNWYKNLVQLADDDWNKFRQHKTISDIQRFAAGTLRLKRDWLLDTEIAQAMSECPSCFGKVNPRAIICSHCRYVLDPERYKHMQFAPAM